MTLRAAYLGPAGTFSEDALRAATAGVEVEAVPTATVHDAILSVASGEVDRALVRRERDRRLGAPDPRHARVRGARRDHRGRAPNPSAMRSLPARRSRSVRSRPWSVIPSRAPSAPVPREELPRPSRIAESTAEAVRTVGASERRGRLWARRRRDLRLRGAPRRRRGRARQRHAVRVDRARRGPRRAQRRLAHDASSPSWVRTTRARWSRR